MNNNKIMSRTRVKISDIHSPPVSVGICTISNIDKFAEIARNNPGLLPEIKLARADGKLYAINHHDVILGCTKAGSDVITEIDGVITSEDCKGSTDILLAHFKEMLENEVFNPASIFDSTYYLQEKLQLQKQDILEMLNINRTPFEKIILSKNNNRVHAKSVEQLQLIVNQLSQRKNLTSSQVCVPLYVISKISRMKEKSHQLQLIAHIQSDLDAMSDATFAWTTPEQIDSMINYIRQDATHEENNREESTVANMTKTEDVGKTQKKSKTESKDSKKNPQTKKLDQETLTVKKSIPNMIIIPDEKTGKPQILVNKRTGAASKIVPSDNHCIIKTASVGTKSLYSIPLDVTKHLEFDEFQIKHRNFGSPVQLIDSISGKMFPKDAKLSVFWSVTQQ